MNRLIPFLILILAGCSSPAPTPIQKSKASVKAVAAGVPTVIPSARPLAVLPKSIVRYSQHAPGSTWQDTNCYPNKLAITSLQWTNGYSVITATAFVKPPPGNYVQGAMGIYHSSDLVNWSLVGQQSGVSSLTVTDYDNGPFAYTAVADATGLCIVTNMWIRYAQIGATNAIAWCQARGIIIPPWPLVDIAPIPTNAGCQPFPGPPASVLAQMNGVPSF
jgi:hypothetical protein